MTGSNAFRNANTGGVPFLQALRVLLQQSIISVLADYSETPREDMSDLIFELEKAGLSMHDLTREADPEYRGIFICRGAGDDRAPIAFVEIPRELGAGGFAVDICRFDRENRTYTLVMRPVDCPN